MTATSTRRGWAARLLARIDDWTLTAFNPVSPLAYRPRAHTEGAPFAQRG